MSFRPATKEIGFVKGSMFGPKGTGKTTMMAMLLIYLSKTYHNSAPVAWLASEKGVDFVLDIFKAEGVPLLLNRSRSFLDLRAASREALKEGACAVGIDSVSHFWQDLFTEGMKARGPRLQRIGRIKEEWAPFAQDFQDSAIHYLVTGRMGFVWDEVEMPDEKGEMVKELSKGGTKIKAEGDFGHEPDLEIETAQMDDPDLVRFDKVGGRARRNFKSQMIHVATVKKCRVWALNGKAFTWKDQPAYKVDYYKKVAEPFRQYFDSINIGGGQGAVRTDHNTSILFESGDERSAHEYQVKRDVAFETWDATIVSLGASGTGKVETKMRMLLGEKITGTRSKTEFGQQSLQQIMRHVSTLMQAERLIKNSGVGVESWVKPEYDAKLGELIDLARADWTEMSFMDAWAPKQAQPVVTAIDEGREESYSA
jgi:hypothetical protein